MNIQELKLKSSEQLITQAEELGIENASTLRKQEILFAILKKVAEKEEITGVGVLQLLQDGFGFLRAMESNYLPGADDIYISPNQIRKFGWKKPYMVTEWGPYGHGESPLTAWGVSVEAKVSTLKVESPPERKEGIKVETVDQLVDKLKNEAKII